MLRSVLPLPIPSAHCHLRNFFQRTDADNRGVGNKWPIVQGWLRDRVKDSRQSRKGGQIAELSLVEQIARRAERSLRQRLSLSVWRRAARRARFALSPRCPVRD